EPRSRAWGLFSALTSPSCHQVGLPRKRFGELLRAMVVAVGQQPPHRFTEQPGERGGEFRAGLFASRASRRRLLLSAATRLFSERGYTRVTTEDVGAAAGIAGPSLYNYFS